MIHWAGKDPALVERAVQMLLRSKFPIQSIDGSGGDDGQDLRYVDADGALVIFEVKSHTDALVPSRRRNIKKSLRRALRHKPSRWVLVMPKNPTPSELAWFEGDLGAAAEATKLEWWGRDWLDGEFAAREDLVRTVEGSDYVLLQRAAEMDREQTVLANGVDDYLERLRGLTDRLDDVSPNWTFDSMVMDGVQTVMLRPKRPDAATVDPISIQTRFNFPPDDPAAQEIRKRLEKALDFGGDITIPAEFVDSFEVTATTPETQRLLGSRERSEDNEIRIASFADTTGLPMPILVSVDAEDGARRRSVEIGMTERLVGTRGMTLSGTDTSGFVNLILVIEDPVRGGTGKTEVRFEFKPLAGRAPHSVLPVLELFGPFEPGDFLTLEVGPVRLGRTVAAAIQRTSDAVDPVMVRYVRALVRLQRHAGKLLPIPVDPEPEAMWMVTAAADVLDGKRARLRYDGLTLSIKPGHMRDFLAAMSTDQGRLYSTHPMSVMVGEIEVDIGETATYAPRVELQDRRALEAVADDGEMHDATFKALDGEGFYLMPPVSPEVGPTTASFNDNLEF